MIGEITFYRHPGQDYRRYCKPGQFFWAPVPFLLTGSVPRLRLDYYNPKKPYNSSYTIEEVNIQRFQPEDADPIYELGLASDEFVLCVTHKFRPVIVVSREVSPWRDYRKKYDECYVVIPLYSTKDPAGEYKFSEQFLLRVQAYQYPTLFYLPEDDEYGVSESLARLDRAVVIHRDLLKPRPVSLTDDALYCLTCWLHYYLGAELDEILDFYRQAALEQLEYTG
jgi:hypothetical protein